MRDEQKGAYHAYHKMWERLRRLYEAEHYEETIETAKRHIETAPDDREARYILAASFLRLGRYVEAEETLDALFAIDPSHIGGLLQLAYLHRALGRVSSEIELLEGLLPAMEEALHQAQHQVQNQVLGENAPRVTEGDLNYIKAQLSEGYSLLGSAYLQGGFSDMALESYLASSAHALKHEEKVTEYSNALFAANYLPWNERQKAQVLTEEFQAFFPEPKNIDKDKSVEEHTGIKRTSRGRKLVLGFVSPDLREHPVAAFLLPFLTHYDRDIFEVRLYANNQEDSISDEMKSLVDVWKNAHPHGWQTLVDEIRGSVDVLFDLAGHSANNALSLFATRLAPVQVTGIGYFNTTGLWTVDYFLTDTTLDPVGVATDDFVERPLRLHHSHFCYRPLKKLPEVASLPCLTKGYITFGSFNNFAKVNDEVLAVWARLLDEVPRARLFLKSRVFASDEGQALTRRRMERCGIDTSRVDVEGFSSDYLERYGEVDIAMDTFPYTGGITTCEALCMGVPVVTLAGKSHGARFGKSLLYNAALPELVAETVDSYIALVKGLAGDVELLAGLRGTLRERVKKSPLMDEVLYTRELEQALLTVCETAGI